MSNEVCPMTTTFAHNLQTWFTWFMEATAAPTKTRRETIAQKAERMVAEGSYTPLRVGEGGAFWVGTCDGDHGCYPVFAIAQWFMDAHGIDGGRVGCQCRHGRPGRLCSHALGAEELRKAGEES